MFETMPGLEEGHCRTFASYRNPVEKNKLLLVNLNTIAIVFGIRIVWNAIVKAIILNPEWVD